MYYTLRNTLSIEMCQQINEMEILQQKRAILANSLVFLWVLDWAAIGSCVDRLLGVLEGRGGPLVGDHGCYCSTRTLLFCSEKN
jgi:hypothetical protein